MSKLRFEIYGDPNSIRFAAYAYTNTRVMQILRELDVAISGRGGTSLDWYISDLSKNGSVAVEVESRVRPPKKSLRESRRDVGPAVTQSFVTGLENLEHRGISPPYLSEFGLDKLNRIVSLLDRSSVNKFVATAVDTDRAVDVTKNSAKTLRDLLPPRRDIEGSVEGRLETISIHRETKFIVYHALTSKAVTCKITDGSYLEIAKEALGSKVYVGGLVSINVKNEPLSVQVRELRVIGKGKRLPLASELTGSDPGFTGILSTDEYIRSIRRA